MNAVFFTEEWTNFLLFELSSFLHIPQGISFSKKGENMRTGKLVSSVEKGREILSLCQIRITLLFLRRSEVLIHEGEGIIFLLF